MANDVPRPDRVNAYSQPDVYGMGLSLAHICPNCGAQTYSLPSVLKVAQDGRLPANLRAAIPDTESAARWLRPPDVPTENVRVRRDIWGPSFFLAVTMVVILLSGLMLCAILGIEIGATITVLAMIGIYWRAKWVPAKKNNLPVDRQRALALKSWDRRMEVWERLGVCPNCGVLSDPVTQRSAEWHSLPNLFV